MNISSKSKGVENKQEGKEPFPSPPNPKGKNKSEAKLSFKCQDISRYEQKYESTPTRKGKTYSMTLEDKFLKALFISIQSDL